MILDLDHFTRKERPYWNELERTLDAIALNPGGRRSVPELERFYYLFQRASADLARMRTFSGQMELRRYLEGLVARAYIELHGERDTAHRFSFWRWLMRSWPQAFRRQWWSFVAAVLITLIGASAGAFWIAVDRENLMLMLPPQFSHLLEDPSERVRKEESADTSAGDPLGGRKLAFAGELMLNNIKVALNALALGALYGVGTVAILFYNGVILGATAWDYVAAGESRFLVGWLLPHGVPELTAIFMGAQAGLVIARAVIGWGSDRGLMGRLRAVRGDVCTLAGGMALMLVWAGLVEAFLSQYHEPVISYGAKTAFGAAELVLLVAFFGFCGRDGGRTKTPRPPVSP